MTFDKLSQYVTARIDELTSITVCGDEAGEGDDLPYVIVTFPFSDFSNVRARGDWIVDLEYWSDSNDKSTIIAAADAVKAGFDYYYQSESEGFYTSHLVSYKGALPSGVPDKKRIHQSYLLKVR